MPLNLNGFNPGIPTSGSEHSQWVTAATNSAGSYTTAMSNLISAFGVGADSMTTVGSGQNAQVLNKTELIQRRQVEFEQAKQMFELFQNMFKSASETVMSVIRRLDPR